MQKKYLAAYIGAIASLAAASHSVQAEDFRLEEIVVTAQKREQSQQDVPIAITAVSAADIERIGATEVKDIQFSTPNLVVAGTNPVQQSFGIRGVSDRGRNPGYDQRIGVYVDGVWVGKSAASNQSALDVQTMEILRGPQGTLFGKNTVAGAINITTKRPTDELSGFIHGEAGNYDKRKIKGTLNAPLSDNLLGKLSFSQETRDGYIKNLNTAARDDLNDKDETAVRAQLLWDVSESTEVLFTVDHFEAEANDILAGEATNDATAPKIHEVSINRTAKAVVDGVGGASFQINHELESGFNLTSITAYRYEDWYTEDYDEDQTAFDGAASNIAADSTHYSQEIRLASPSGETFDYVLGLYYLQQDIEGDGSALLNPALLGGPNTIVTAAYDTEIEVTSWAAFAHSNYQLTDNLQLTAGIRYTEETKDVDFAITDATGFFTTDSAKDDRKSTDVSPKVSLNWFVSEDVMLYAGYSRAFKSGGYNTDFIADLDGLEFDDELVDAFEVGMKSTWLDGRLRLNAAIFESQHEDFQVQAQTPVSGGGSILTVSNAGELTSKGMEMDMQFMATEWLRMWASYGYTDAKFDEFLGCAAPGGDCSGNRPSEAPKENYNIGAEVTIPALGGEVFANLNYFWRDEMYSNPTNTDVQLNEEYEELGGRVGWTSANEDWTVYLWGKNLTDKETQVYNSTTFLSQQRSLYNQPRMFGVAMRWNFGM